MKTEYKGITITEDKQGMFHTFDKEYGSMSAAKGAITRWVNANVEAVQKQEEVEVPAACKAVVTALEAASKPSSFTNAKNDKGEPIAANPKLAQVYAEMDYYGMAKTRDTRSRNKREGKYAFKTPKRHMMHLQEREQRSPRHSRGVQKFK